MCVLCPLYAVMYVCLCREGEAAAVGESPNKVGVVILN